MKGPICRGGKFTTAMTFLPKRFRTVKLGDLRRRFAGSDLGAKIDDKLDRRLPGFRKWGGLNDRPAPDVDLHEIVEGRKHHVAVIFGHGCLRRWALLVAAAGIAVERVLGITVSGAHRFFLKGIAVENAKGAAPFLGRSEAPVDILQRR